VQELLNHPPPSKAGDPRFVGRDWRQIRVGELVDKNEVRWAELDVGVEQATKVHSAFETKYEVFADLSLDTD
jgi:hypothetical protein